MEKVSVIIPAYNVEKYISRTLNSILNQTYSNIEIIVINDGSKDNTDNIIKKYAKENRNIIYKSRENKGAMATRKEALEYVSGEYVMFIDGDDWIERDCIKKIMFEKKDKDPDIIRFLYVKDFEKQSRKIYLQSPYSQNTYINKERFDKDVYPVICKTYFYNSMCCQLIKREIIDKEKINIGYIMGEDFLFNLELITNAKSIMIINEFFYHYVYNDNSITTKSDLNVRKKSIEDVLNVYSNLLDYIKMWRVEYLSDIIYDRILREYIIQLREIIISNNKIKYSEFRNIIEKKHINFFRKNIKGTYSLNNILIINQLYYIFFIKEKCCSKIKMNIKKILFK